MVDFGMVGTIPPDMRDILMDMVFAMIDRDFHKAVQNLRKAGFITKEGSDHIIAASLGIFLEHILGSHADLTQPDLNFLFKNMEKMLYEQPFQIPANFTFLGKALGTLYGICMKLNPDINFFDEAKPFIEQISPPTESIGKIFKDKTVSLANSFVNLPALTERVMLKAERGELEFNIYWPELRGDIKTVRKTLRSLGYMMAACFALSISAYFYVNHLIAPARYMWILTLLFLVLFLKNAYARTRRNMRNRWR
jgi:predicted unusual protein kinase regulating ubiquinone biosynthesis (AarF/ABC1/UbiB family)